MNAEESFQAKLSARLNQPAHERVADTFDLFIFAGQSNMAGRGVAATASKVPTGTGFEYRAVTAPTQLSPLIEPFGVDENRIGGINEPGMKTGSLVSALVNAYYHETGRVVVGVSAAKGGSAIQEWQPGQAFLTDALIRLDAAKKFLKQPARIALVWCQGETDGDLQTAPGVYQQRLDQTLKAFYEAGVAHTFMIQIGQHNTEPDRYRAIGGAQLSYCQKATKATMVSTVLQHGREWHLMKDDFHYRQPMYEMCGTEAGLNIAKWYRSQVK